MTVTINSESLSCSDGHTCRRQNMDTAKQHTKGEMITNIPAAVQENKTLVAQQHDYLPFALLQPASG